MALSVGELVAYLSLDKSQFNRGLSTLPSDAAAAGSKAGTAGGTAAGKGFGSSMFLGFKGFLGPMAAIAAGSAVVGFLGSAKDAGSDFNETLNKATVIFGDNIGAVDKWSKGAATGMGLSRQAALDAAASFGDMFSQLGFLPDQAAQMSQSVVQMSADLGSFNNLPTEDVADRISAAFRGEYDSLQKLIPNISAARVESEAMAMTGKKNADQLTAQEKAAAVLAIVQKDGARAMGDFARTSDGAANKQKILAARMQDLKTSIGRGVLPVWNLLLDAASFLMDLFPKIGKVIGDFVKKNQATFQGWWAKLQGIFDGLKDLVTAVVAVITKVWKEHGDEIMGAIQRVWGFISGTISNALSFIQGLIDVVLGLVTGHWGRAWDGLKKMFGAVWDEIKKLLSLALDFIQEIIGGAMEWIWHRIQDGWNIVIEWLKTLPGLLAGAVVGLWDWVWERAKLIKDAVVLAVTNFFDWVGALPTTLSTKAGAIWKWISDKAGTIKDEVVEGFSDFEQWLTALPGWIASKAGDVWGWLVEKAKAAAYAAVKWILDIINDALGGGGSGSSGGTGRFSRPGIPGHAEGAIVRRPHFGMIGEKGPEAILPLKQYERFLDKAFLAGSRSGGGVDMSRLERIVGTAVAAGRTGSDGGVTINWHEHNALQRSQAEAAQQVADMVRLGGAVRGD